MTSLQKSNNKKIKQLKLAEELLALLVKLGTLTIVFILLFQFVFGIFRFTKNNMTPAIKDGDLILFNRFDKSYQAGDVIVAKIENKKEIFRVIALPKDKVDITNQGLLINGNLQLSIEKGYVQGETLPFKEGIVFPLVVPEKTVFVLSDQRENGKDSRIFGPLPQDKILGKIMIDIRRRNF